MLPLKGAGLRFCRSGDRFAFRNSFQAGDAPHPAAEYAAKAFLFFGWDLKQNASFPHSFFFLQKKEWEKKENADPLSLRFGERRLRRLGGEGAE